MAFIPVPNTASLQLIYEVNGNKCENVINVHQNNPFAEVNLADAAEVVVTWFGATGKMIMCDDVVLTKIVATSLESSSAPSIEYLVGLPIAGNDAVHDILPLNVTAAVSFGTEKRGRSFRGRVYEVGLANNAIVGNQLETAYRAALIAKWADLVAALNVAALDMVVVSRYANKAARNTGITTDINSVSVDINVDSQRRRLNGRGQ